MKLLFTGNCARSHAIIDKILDDARIEHIYWAPGNAGLRSSRVENIPIAADDGVALADFASKNQVDFTIVSQNYAMFAGVVNAFQAAGLPVYGPTREMAALEWNKIWAKDFFAVNGIPSPAHRLVQEKDYILKAAQDSSLPVVIKYGGLAYGGGVFICHSRDEARQAVGKITASRLKTISGGDDAVIFEEVVTGEEVSMHFMVANGSAVFVGGARDYKRALDGDQGSNTAGMGSFSPSGHVDGAIVQQVQEQIIHPTIQGMRAKGLDYHGVLYAGVMLTERGPMLLEYNCRFGDSECQALLGRLDSNLLDLFLAEDLSDVQVEINDRTCMTVCMCTRDYPSDAGIQEHPISGLDQVDPEIRVFHYGTKRQGDQILTPTGRVLSVTADGESKSEVREKIYRNVGKISWPGVRYRRDIGVAE